MRENKKNCNFSILGLATIISLISVMPSPLVAESLDILPRISGPILNVLAEERQSISNGTAIFAHPNQKERHGKLSINQKKVLEARKKKNSSIAFLDLSPQKENILTITKKNTAAPVHKNQILYAKSNLEVIKKPRTYTVSSRPKDMNSEAKPSVVPHYYEGLYLTNHTIRHSKYYLPILKKAESYSLNTLVVDVQPKMPNKKFMNRAKQGGFYLVARIVVFPGGLKQYPPAKGYLNKIYALVESSARHGFHEIQLDYIRFADRNAYPSSLAKRYQCIEQILKQVDLRLKPYPVLWGADLFGRVAFNQNDRIGQRLELFTPYTDTLYLMLYPSHFYGMPNRIKDPYKTIFTAVKNSIRRVGKQERIVAYIQAFRMSINITGLSFINYIYQQLRAAKQAKGGGYIAWNARNQYNAFFQGLSKYRRDEKKLFPTALLK